MKHELKCLCNVNKFTTIYFDKIITHLIILPYPSHRKREMIVIIREDELQQEQDTKS